MPRADPLSAAPTMDDLLDAPSVSYPLKAVLLVWAGRDPVDAARDAELLAAVTGGWAEARLRIAHVP